MGDAYCLHTPNAVSVALRRGMSVVDHPYRGGPFFLLMPMNTQPQMIASFNLEELPAGPLPAVGAASDNAAYAAAAEAIRGAKRVVVKVGGGARMAGKELVQFLDLADAVAVLSPLVSGVIPYQHPRNMTVGGSKGSLCGNYAMEEADLLVALGTRFVCQSDCSRTGYPNVRRVININADFRDATHYNKTIPLVGDVAGTLERLNAELQKDESDAAPSAWFFACYKKRQEWQDFKAQRYAAQVLLDDVWERDVLTQPAAIKTATDWARSNGVVSFFDAGDVQANGFQIVEDDCLGRTFTETGASYMGFAVSALLATAMASKPFYGLALTGDGSFTMNPQVLIDGVMHGARGCILLLDNRRMGAISGLQDAQYGAVCATSDTVEVDYVAWAAAVKGVQALSGGKTVESLQSALDRAIAHEGLSLIHVPVYYGPNPLGGMGVFGRWNVGNWCEDTQWMRHDIGL
jgi:3D-(3,5/4)-trihydroxycyclohexane-1,2-dione acylhydrolase (decyclizing)